MKSHHKTRPIDIVYLQFNLFKKRGDRIVEKRKINPEDLTQNDIAFIHKAIIQIASFCDGAYKLDGMGFNKNDAEFGRSLASQDHLSKKQAARGLEMIWKYKGQLDSETINRLDIIFSKCLALYPRSFAIIPEFFREKCLTIHVIDEYKMSCVYHFSPGEFDSNTRGKLLEIGLTDIDIKEIDTIIEGVDFVNRMIANEP